MVSLLIFLQFAIGEIAFGQILLENIDGKDILSVIKAVDKTKNGINITLNSTDKTLGLFSYIKLDNEIIAKQFLSLDVKGKANNSYSTIISDGKLNSGVEFKGSYIKQQFFLKEESYLTDWITIGAGVDLSDYDLFDPAAEFDKQLTNQEYSGFQFGTSYSLFLGGDSSTKDKLITVGFNYLRDNTAGGLESVDIREVNTIPGGSQTSYREQVSNKSALLGEYKEFDSFDINLSLSILPSEAEGENRSGFNLFAIRNFNGMQNTLNTGFIYFVTKQNEKTGIRTPVIGLVLQVNDLFDEKDLGNTLDKRLVFGITSSISLNKVLGI